VAAQARHNSRVHLIALALLGLLLRCAALVEESGRARQVATRWVTIKPNTGVQLARLQFGHDKAQFAPAPRLIDEAGPPASDLNRPIPALMIIEQWRVARALPFTRPGGPTALKANTQSRTVCSPTPPILAASLRDPPS
jgi:hypothetical protein